MHTKISSKKGIEEVFKVLLIGLLFTLIIFILLLSFYRGSIGGIGTAFKNILLTR